MMRNSNGVASTTCSLLKCLRNNMDCVSDYYLDYLPPELLLEIFDYLSVRDVFRLCQINSTLRGLYFEAGIRLLARGCNMGESITNTKVVDQMLTRVQEDALDDTLVERIRRNMDQMGGIGMLDSNNPLCHYLLSLIHI